LTRQVLGRDEDGDEISSLVACHADSVEAVLETARTKRESSIARFLEAVGDGRPEGEVRKAFYSSMEDATPDARKKAYQRARAAALNCGLVTVQGDWISRSEAGHE
jgi:hypothetical protein